MQGIGISKASHYSLSLFRFAFRWISAFWAVLRDPTVFHKAVIEYETQGHDF